MVQAVNKKMVDEIGSVMEAGKTASEIRDELVARGYDGSLIDKSLASPSSDMIGENTAMEAMQQIKDQVEKRKKEEVAALEEEANKQKDIEVTKEKQKIAEGLQAEQDALKKKGEADKRQVIIEDDKKAEKEAADAKELSRKRQRAEEEKLLSEREADKARLRQ
jgi:hypothetical protein